MLDEELVRSAQELLGDVVGASPKVQVKVLTVVSDFVTHLIEQVKPKKGGRTMAEGIIDAFLKDIRPMLGKLPTASDKEQTRLMTTIAVTAEYVANQLLEELEFECTLEVFNQHGAEADPPFGAMLINGRVLVCNYRTLVGVWVNGHVKDKSFITREVEVRKHWPKGEKGYE